jgi:hypothetical protein
LFAGLFWPSIVHSWLLAGRLGVASVVALWTVVWLLHARRSGLFALAPAGAKAASPPSPLACTDVDPRGATVLPGDPPAASAPQGTAGEPGGTQP